MSMQLKGLFHEAEVGGQKDAYFSPGYLRLTFQSEIRRNLVKILLSPYIEFTTLGLLLACSSYLC